MYALTVASKSSSTARKDAALKIMERMREHSPILVEQVRLSTVFVSLRLTAMIYQALLVSQELIRVAILWHEMWHEALDEAARLYFTEKNPEAMMETLDPLHELMEDGPMTKREVSFVHTFGRDLMDARQACNRYRQYGETRDLDRAWEIYYMVHTVVTRYETFLTKFQVHRKVEKQLNLSTLDLQYVSPSLLHARDLVLAVPGLSP